MQGTSVQEIKLFYCYAREDKALRDKLEKYLSSLKRLYLLRNWHDREILPGEDWEQAIDSHLSTAHLILLLVSPDFMSSAYCYGKEMQRALERHEEGTCKVIPIILRPTYLEAAPFNKLQMLPTDGKPITRWADRDEAFQDVVKEISLVLKDLLNSLKTKKDWLDEGISFRNLKRYDHALEAFEKALRLDPKYLEVYREKGITLLDLERYDSALETFEQALHIDPNLASLYVVKGQILNTLKRNEEALTSFEQAIQLDPNLANAYIGRDKVLQQLGISREVQERIATQLEKAQQKLVLQQKQFEQLDQVQEQRDKALQQLSISKKTQDELEGQLREARQQIAVQQKQSEQLESQLAQVQEQRDKALQQLSTYKKPQKVKTDDLQTQANKHLTIYLAFDVSGSMAGSPIEEAKRAAREFLKKCNLYTTSIGIISVSDRAHVDLVASQNGEDILTAIDKLRAGSTGYTNTGHPFDAIYDLCREVPDFRYAIVLADDVWSNQNDAISQAQRCQQADIKIIAIGFGGADRQFLAKIASIPEMSFFTSLAGLTDTYRALADEITEAFSKGI